MSDIFNEIDEELRRDKAALFFKRHGKIVGVLAVLVVLVTGGWVTYERLQREKAEEAGARYEAALNLSRTGKGEEAVSAFETIARSSTDGYRALALLRGAAEMGKADAEKGAGAYDGIAADPKVPADLRALAKLRAAMLRFDTAEPKATQDALAPLAQAAGLFRNEARELLGLSALKGGDYEGAGRWFDQIVTDAGAPQALTSRVEVYLGLVRSGPVPAKTQ